MKVHEYQAKELLAKYGVPVPNGRVATTPAEAREIALELGGPTVVKAQIHAGGRGKGGGIKLAATLDEAEAAAKQIIGMTLVTHQTGPEGQLVRSVLVEDQTAGGARAVSGGADRQFDRLPDPDGILGRRHGNRGGRRDEPRRRSTAWRSTRQPAFSLTRGVNSPSRWA